MVNNRKSEQEWVNEWNTWLKPYDKKILNGCQKVFPVDILQLSQDLGVQVYIPYIETNLEGWIEFNGVECEIYLNQKFPEVRQRFTLAHELSHFLFHQKDIIEKGHLDRGYLTKGYFDMKEWHANLYASEILMPTEAINQDIENDPHFLKDKQFFSEYIKKKYNVSLQVALKRASRAIKAFEGAMSLEEFMNSEYT